MLGSGADAFSGLYSLSSLFSLRGFLYPSLRAFGMCIVVGTGCLGAVLWGVFSLGHTVRVVYLSSRCGPLSLSCVVFVFRCGCSLMGLGVDAAGRMRPVHVL